MNDQNHITQKLAMSVILYLDVVWRHMCYTPVCMRVADPLIGKLFKIREMPVVLIEMFYTKDSRRKINICDF